MRVELIGGGGIGNRRNWLLWLRFDFWSSARLFYFLIIVGQHIIVQVGLFGHHGYLQQSIQLHSLCSSLWIGPKPAILYVQFIENLSFSNCKLRSDRTYRIFLRSTVKVIGVKIDVVTHIELKRSGKHILHFNGPRWVYRCSHRNDRRGTWITET